MNLDVSLKFPGKTLKGAIWLLLAVCGNQPEGDTGTRRKELSNKNKPELDDLGEFSACLDCDTKMERFTVGRSALEKKLTVCLDNLLLTSLKNPKVQVFGHVGGLFEEIQCVTHRSHQLSQQTPKQKWNYPGSMCEGASDAMERISTWDIHKVLESFISGETVESKLEGTERVWNERRLQAGSRLKQWPSWKQVLFFMTKNKRLRERAKPWATEYYP